MGIRFLGLGESPEDLFELNIDKSKVIIKNNSKYGGEEDWGQQKREDENFSFLIYPPS